MKRISYALALVTSFGLLLVACSDKLSTNASPQVESLLDLGALNRNIDPCEDFYEFACGTWLKETEIPAGYSRWTKSFSTIDKENRETVKALLEGYAKPGAQVAGPAKLLGDYFAACMDEAAAEKVTEVDLPAELASVEAMNSKETLFTGVAGLHLKGVSAFFTFRSDQDYADATSVIGSVDRSGLGLPDKDYYLSQDQKRVKLREAYLAHVAKTLTLAGSTQATQQAEAVLRVETEMAKSMLSLEERRTPSNIYHPIGVAGLKQASPNLAWEKYFSAMGTQGVSSMNVVEPVYFAGLNTLIQTTSLEDLKTYLRWQLLRAFSPNLGKAFVDQNFAFYSTTLNGQKTPTPRWQACVTAADAMGEALGEEYVKRKFSGEAKARASEMIGQIRLALADNIRSLEWMDDATKTQAIAKLQKISPKIGYPDKWLDYSSIAIQRASYLRNDLNIAAFQLKRNLDKIGKPVDKAEWGMFPHTVNAYYNPTMNEIVFPAAILQPPFFKNTAVLGANYGAAGMVMGHEITHGFDDEGRNFDGDGNLKTWWTPAVAAAFKTRAQCLVDQYDGYTVAGGVHLNGKLELGENIADLGGLKLSWKAYQLAKANQQEAPIVGGFNQDQQFFLQYAQVWCTKATPEVEQLRAQTDPHAAPRYRVNGVMVNTPEFEKAFSCKRGAAMAPAKRCAIW